MNNSNVYIVGLALCTLGNIASQEMSRDLVGEIERLLSSTNSFLRKKAALCALRIIRKVPDLIENFVDRAQALLSERNHGVLLTGVTLITEMCILSPEVTAALRDSVPMLSRHLKNLVTAGSSPEHDVSGITDPFLQVKILRLLRILGKGDVRSSEAMNDVLAQVATTTEASKNVGNSILYEAVLTIMNVESESSLRVLGINILGKFLANRDNNIKYVALMTLSQTFQTATATDSSALQRHRSTVIDCLKDPDISIRRRALDLSFYLINTSNIRILTRELLSFLEMAEGDIKSSVASRICDYAGRFRPNKRWEIDTVTRVLRVSGAYVDQAVINYFVKLVSTGDSSVHQYTVRKLFHIIKTEGEQALIQEGLLQAGFWCIGEYGDVLVSKSSTPLGFADQDETEGEKTGESLNAPSEREVFELIVSVLRGPYATSFVKEYAITCLLKLCARFVESEIIEMIKTLISKYKVNIDVEIQQRAVEYHEIFALERDVRVALLEHMPVLESAVESEAHKGTGDGPAGTAAAQTTTPKPADLLGADLAGLALGGPSTSNAAGLPQNDILGLALGSTNSSPAGKPTTQAARQENIMDLLGGIGLGSTAVTVAAPAKTTDLLGDLFGGSPPKQNNSVPPLVSTSPQKAAATVDPLASLIGNSLSTTASPAAALQTPVLKAYPCYDKHGLKITLSPTRETDLVTNVLATFTNVAEAASTISSISLLIAVPKILGLTMQPASQTTLERGQTATQAVKINNPSKAAIRLRLKVAFSVNGQNIDEIAEFSSFDPSLWS